MRQRTHFPTWGHGAFSLVAGFGGLKLTGLPQKASSRLKIFERSTLEIPIYNLSNGLKLLEYRITNFRLFFNYFFDTLVIEMIDVDVSKLFFLLVIFCLKYYVLLIKYSFKFPYNFLFNYVGTLIQRKELQKGEEGGEKEKKRKNKWTNWLVN